MMNKNYEELIKIPDFEKRFLYLKLDSKIGELTFSGHRHLNQDFYKSPEWKKIRRDIIIRDNGCDLACQDKPINGIILIHHIEPITIEDLLYRRPIVTDYNNLICSSIQTHKAIHYGDIETLIKDYTPRKPNDTCPWRVEI